MKRVKKYYNKFANKATSTLTNIALEKFVKSDYLKETATTIPLTLLTVCTRGVFNFLITSRLKTGIYFVDFIFSLCITIIFSLYSPIFYHIYQKSFEKDVDYFSTITILSIWLEGWDFIELWKGRILGSISVFIILILFFVEVNSRMIQEFIFHTLISSIIVDYLSNLSIHRNQKPIFKAIPESEKPNTSLHEDVQIIEEYTNRKKCPSAPPVFGKIDQFEVSSEVSSEVLSDSE